MWKGFVRCFCSDKNMIEHTKFLAEKITKSTQVITHLRSKSSNAVIEDDPYFLNVYFTEVLPHFWCLCSLKIMAFNCESKHKPFQNKTPHGVSKHRQSCFKHYSLTQALQKNIKKHEQAQNVIQVNVFFGQVHYHSHVPKLRKLYEHLS